MLKPPPQTLMQGMREKRGSHMDVRLVVGLMFVVFGTVFAASGIYMILKTRKFIDGSQKVFAEVISVRESYETDEDGDTTTTYRPTVRFQTLDGVEHTAETFYGSSSYDYNVGTNITVLYKPGEETVRVPGGMNQYFVPGMFTGMGSVFAIVGLVVAIFG
jgi:hypothetical protein